MRIIKRILGIRALTDQNSYFLLGPRGTGKSYMIRHGLKAHEIDYIDLLSSKTLLLLQRDPSALESMIFKPLVVIDEIQRVPELLNEVHRLIEERGVRFLLTGSSARKLKRDGVNLLAGRAYRAELFSMTWQELSAHKIFDLKQYLTVGGLPKAYVAKEYFDYLYAYVDTYLREEIQAESLVRNLPNYARFLEMAAQMNGEMVNFSKVASDAQLALNTVRDYFQILQDTLLGYFLPTWKKSNKRKAIQTPKFYFADIGVAHALRNIENVQENTDLYGRAFEHFIGNELRAYVSYARKRVPITYWRSTSQFEVDFVIGDDIAIAVKSGKKVTERDHKGLHAIAEEQKWKHLLLVSRDSQARSFKTGVQHIYWEEFLDGVWQGKYF